MRNIQVGYTEDYTVYYVRGDDRYIVTGEGGIAWTSDTEDRAPQQADIEEARTIKGKRASYIPGEAVRDLACAWGWATPEEFTRAGHVIEDMEASRIASEEEAALDARADQDAAAWAGRVAKLEPWLATRIARDRREALVKALEQHYAVEPRKGGGIVIHACGTYRIGVGWLRELAAAWAAGTFHDRNALLDHIRGENYCWKGRCPSYSYFLCTRDDKREYCQV